MLEVKAIALTGKWDAKECLSRQAAATVEECAKFVTSGIGNQYSKGDMSGLEHKIQHGLTAGIAEAAAGMVESAIMGEKAHQLFERSLAAGFASILAESVAEAVYDPKEHINATDLDAIQMKAAQTVDQRLEAGATQQTRAAAVIQEERVLMMAHLAPHKESAKKLGQIATIVAGALTNNERMLSAMFTAATRALEHNFMEHIGHEESILLHERAGRQLNWMQKSVALIMLARAGIQIINILPCGRALKGARYIYKIGNTVRTFNKIEDAIRFVNTEVAGASQIVGAAYNDLVSFGDVLERDGLKAAGTHVYAGCENWVNDNITQGLDIDGSAALDQEVFKAYDGPQESIFEKKSTKASGSSGTRSDGAAPAARSSASTGGPTPPEDPDDQKNPKKADGTFKTPKEFEIDFKPRRGGSKESKLDGSIWEKDTAEHGGEQFKRWPNKRSWERGDKPNSIWPNGSVRK